MFSLVEGLLTSCVVFFIPYFSLRSATTYDGHDLADLGPFSFMAASILILAVTLRVSLLHVLLIELCTHHGLTALILLFFSALS